jgi:hypothetical protein
MLQPSVSFRFDSFTWPLTEQAVDVTLRDYRISYCTFAKHRNTVAALEIAPRCLFPLLRMHFGCSHWFASFAQLCVDFRRHVQDAAERLDVNAEEMPMKFWLDIATELESRMLQARDKCRNRKMTLKAYEDCTGHPITETVQGWESQLHTHMVED